MEILDFLDVQLQVKLVLGYNWSNKTHMSGQHMITLILDDITELISTGVKTNPFFSN